MKTAKLTHRLEKEGIKILKINNEMAPLTIEGHEEDYFEVDAKLLMDPDELPPAEGLFTFVVKDDVAVLDLEMLPEMRQSIWSSRVPKIHLKMPMQIMLEVETEDMPTYISGLSAVVEVETENGPLIVSNCEGKLEIESENAPIKLRNIAGKIKIEMENASLSAEALQGDSLDIESENGPVKIRSASFGKVRIESENGAIYYETLPLEDGDFEIESENGNIHLVLPVDFDFELDAEIENGKLSNSIDAQWSQDDEKIHLWRGEKTVKIRLKTENGMIRLSPDGHINLDYLRQKLEGLKESINSAQSLQDKETVQKHLHNVVDYVNKLLGHINEEKVKHTVKTATDKLTNLVAIQDFAQTKDKLILSVEDFGREVSQSMGSFWEKVRGKMGHEFNRSRIKEHLGQLSGIGEKINKGIQDGMRKIKGFEDMGEDEHERMLDFSRIKILEMLESGKITTEEAERLLKAIGKE
ncbi:MAG: DUF4097 family beta strand repeat protein [Candidatus Cloacimonetes bacterium]|nr:DUF4097 family beta strand repeat protein [Candidatus Cloacimonadota bacterium]